MVISKTPFRMSFFGGGTDFPDYFEEKPGAVLSTTIDKYCYVTVRSLPDFFEHKIEVTYSHTEKVHNIDEINHPAIRNAMKMMGVDRIRLVYDGDLPARSGLGTSSSFAVGMLQCFHALKGETVSRRQLADEAIYLERVLCQEEGGWQDQIAAAYGGFNRIDFKNNSYSVEPLPITERKREELQNNLLMFFTGFTRNSAEIQKCTRREKKIELYQEMYQLVSEAEKILISNEENLDEFGKLLDYTWELKKKTGSKITTDTIDLIYETARIAGATGGKLLGAGGGGFLLLYVPKEKQIKVKEVLSECMQVPFRFESEGTNVIFNNLLPV